MTAQTEPPPGSTPRPAPPTPAQPAPTSSPMPTPAAVPEPKPGHSPHGSMTEAPPWIGGVTIGTFFATAAVLITYTLLPLPGQRSLGDVNYLVAGVLFAVHMTFNRLYRTGVGRRATTSSQQSRPERPGAPAE